MFWIDCFFIKLFFNTHQTVLLFYFNTIAQSYFANSKLVNPKPFRTFLGQIITVYLGTTAAFQSEIKNLFKGFENGHFTSTNGFVLVNTSAMGSEATLKSTIWRICIKRGLSVFKTVLVCIVVFGWAKGVIELVFLQ